MIDDAKRKKLIYASAVFIAIAILSFVAFLILNKKEDLPPIEAEETSKTDNTTHPIAPPSETDDSIVFKNGITFKQFDEMSRYAITDGRIDVTRYYLALYANQQASGAISTFTLDRSTVKQTKEGEKTTFTFNVTDDANKPYKVTLSYTYAADAYVQIFDKDNKVIQVSPYDSD